MSKHSEKLDYEPLSLSNQRESFRSEKVEVNWHDGVDPVNDPVKEDLEKYSPRSVTQDRDGSGNPPSV